ncbi:PEP-CTERM sorting domain-containing protein [Massilia sp. TWR1-2-2]|uniref:PEP-CTERM sorting domain-containing protein n=1 Tax=Massilia sp. TWR1-2-2 TaxID=2804584 RepID=UPI003CFB196F
MKSFLKLAATLLAVVALHAPVSAAPIVDQSNPVRWGGFCFTNDNGACGQSFRQNASNISGAGFFVDPGYGDGSAGSVTISLYSGYAPTSSNLLASGTVSGVNKNSEWVDVFWNPVAITSGAQYFLIMQSTHSIVASFGSPDYASGNAVFAGTTTGYASFDLTFRTYADNSVSAQVPEPGSLGLLAIGFAGLGLTLRRNAKSKRAV